MNTTQRKIKETIIDLKEWIESPFSEKDLNMYGLDEIKQNLKEKKVLKSVIGGFESINNWYSNHFVYEMLIHEESKLKTKLIASGYHIFKISEILTDLSKYMTKKEILD